MIPLLDPPAMQRIEEAGALTNNHRLVESLRSGLSSGKHAYDIVPAVVEEIVEENAWRDRLDRNGGRHTFPAEGFEKFITDPPPAGLGVTLDEVRQYLGRADNPARLAFEEAVDRGRGNRSAASQARDEDGVFIRFPNKVRETDDPTKDENDEYVIDKPPRNRSREPKAGNSLGYAIRRLGRERPDLLARVKAREISPNKAMIEAGFRLPSITLPIDPVAASRLIIKHFKGDALKSLVRELVNWCDGSDVPMTEDHAS